MWLDCVTDKAYSNRESLAADVVRLLREEAEQLIVGGAAIVQFDEPVLTEVVFGKSAGDSPVNCLGNAPLTANHGMARFFYGLVFA